MRSVAARTASADTRLAGASPTPDVDDREREQNGRIELRRDRDSEQAETQPVSRTGERDDRGEREKRRPEVEAGENDRAEQERRKAGQQRARRDARRRRALPGDHEPDQGSGNCTAQEHESLEGLAIGAEVARRSEQGWGRERSERGGRVLDREVPVRDLRVMHDRVSVSLVDRSVHENVAGVEAVVQRTERDQEGRRRERGRDRARKRTAATVNCDCRGPTSHSGDETGAARIRAAPSRRRPRQGY